MLYLSGRTAPSPAATVASQPENAVECSKDKAELTQRNSIGNFVA
jgi:hypothetical protein